MAGRVAGKVVLLTGGAMGLGKASAKAGLQSLNIGKRGQRHLDSKTSGLFAANDGGVPQIAPGFPG